MSFSLIELPEPADRPEYAGPYICALQYAAAFATTTSWHFWEDSRDPDYVLYRNAKSGTVSQCHTVNINVDARDIIGGILNHNIGGILNHNRRLRQGERTAAIVEGKNV